jgi:hypothetical protein
MDTVLDWPVVTRISFLFFKTVCYICIFYVETRDGAQRRVKRMYIDFTEI